MSSLAAWLWLGAVGPAEGQGIVLQFDDGYENWIEVVAPVLQVRGAKATAYVNTSRLDKGTLNVSSLRSLQDDFGWEIGTHTVNHKHAPRYTARKSLEAWVTGELEPSINTLRRHGLEVSTMAFPFNASTPDLAAEVTARLCAYRTPDPLGISAGVRPGGSLPGRSMDIEHYAPVENFLDAARMAADQGQFLVLFGHRILADDVYQEAQVSAVGEDWIEVDAAFTLDPAYKPWILVPDLGKVAVAPSPFLVKEVQGNRVYLELKGVDLFTAPGLTCMVGPSYTTRLSWFEALLDGLPEDFPFLLTRELCGSAGM